MENILSVVIPLALLLLFIRIMLIPMKLIWKILVNSVCGFLCLWLLNTISGFTGILFPINLVTAAVAGFLGLPGIVLLGLVQLFL